MKNPIRTTVVFALASGALVVPLAMILSAYLYWPSALKLMLWADLTVYGILLARWSGLRPLSLLFPLSILLGAAIWPGVYGGFFILSLGVFSWMRSGICFQHKPVRALTAEVLTVIGGASVVLLFDAHSSAAWALHICLFFLIQSLYFFIVPVRASRSDDDSVKDPFEKSVEAVQKILNGI